MRDRIKDRIEEIKVYLVKFIGLLNKNTLQNVIVFSGGIMVFIFGVIIYGVILNMREYTLEEAMSEKGIKELVNPSIVVEKNHYILKLYSDTLLVKTYRASFGRNANHHKQKAGDNATPEGEYKICLIDSSAKYYKFFRLNYPNLRDAAEALRKGMISQQVYDKLQFEFYYQDCTSEDTPLGGNIGIHGLGELDYFFKNLPFIYNWTDGSIAVSNESMDELNSVITKGTKVVIK